VLFWILDFGFWIALMRRILRSGVNPKSKIQNPEFQMRANSVAFTLSMMILAALLPLVTAHGDSLFKAASNKPGTLIAKMSRFQVGDIITVNVNEAINASTTANTNTKKESSVKSAADAGSNQFLTAEKPGLNILPQEQLPNWDIEAKNETKARGQTDRVAKLKTSVSCLVTKVVENGNVYIEGEKTVSMNREDSRLSVSGIVRVRDVTPANTIDSNQIANATISLKGKGPLWNNQRRGLVTRLLDWFSPF
jgi:flagellar L-ring protein precursor FlgH